MPLKKPVPVLGIIYNVVSLATIPALIVGAIMQSETVMYAAIAFMVPTIFLPETKGYRAYWKKFE